MTLTPARKNVVWTGPPATPVAGLRTTSTSCDESPSAKQHAPVMKARKNRRAGGGVLADRAIRPVIRASATSRTTWTVQSEMVRAAGVPRPPRYPTAPAAASAASATRTGSRRYPVLSSRLPCTGSADRQRRVVDDERGGLRGVLGAAERDRDGLAGVGRQVERLLHVPGPVDVGVRRQYRRTDLDLHHVVHRGTGVLAADLQPERQRRGVAPDRDGHRLGHAVVVRDAVPVEPGVVGTAVCLRQVGGGRDHPGGCR